MSADHDMPASDAVEGGFTIVPRAASREAGGVDIVTFGCRLNAYESEVIRARAAEDGLSNAIVFNTCAVTGEAVRQARQAIRKARRERPGARLIVTGCAAQIDPTAFAAMPEVDLVLGNAEKAAPGALFSPERVRVSDIMSQTEVHAPAIDGRGDDPCWQKAEWSGGFTQSDPDCGAAPSEPAKAKPKTPREPEGAFENAEIGDPPAAAKKRRRRRRKPAGGADHGDSGASTGAGNTASED